MNQPLRALLLAWLALFGSVALAAPAAAPGKTQRLTSPDQVPAGLAKSDWQGIRAAYAARRHEFQPSPLTTDPIAQQAYLKASNTEAEDWFGPVAVSGDTVVVGAMFEDSNATGVNGNQGNKGATSSGAAYVFVRNGTTWTQQAYLKASDAAAGDGFGGAVAVSGDTVVVGAIGEASNATGVNGNETDNSAGSSGAAYVFVRSGKDWIQQAYLKASNTGAVDGFGDSVAVSGDTVVVGAGDEASNATGVNAPLTGGTGTQADNSARSAGAAYVFVRSGATWSQQAYLKASNTGAFEQFGLSVAVSGDTVVVGSIGEASNATGVNGNETDNSTFGAGAAYVFVRNGTGWTQQAYLKASNTGTRDIFGWSVAVSGDTVVVGGAGEASNATGVNGNQTDNSASSAGAAYLFTGVGPVTPPLAGLTLRLASGAGGERRFVATGIPGGAHRLQAAATIAGPWTDVPGAGAAGTAAANGELLLEDATPPSDTIFYRAVGP